MVVNGEGGVNLAGWKDGGYGGDGVRASAMIHCDGDKGQDLSSWAPEQHNGSLAAGVTSP